MIPFKWTKKKESAALSLAQGYTQVETFNQTGVPLPTIKRWCSNIEFSAEVDRLSLMVGIASRAERLRITMQIIRQKLDAHPELRTEKDLLDWFKFAQSETDGAKIDLSSFFENMEPTESTGTKTS